MSHISSGLPDSQRSKRMRDILRIEVLPQLRELGFKGNIPHFYRLRGDRLDLLNIQFSYQGPHFFVNLGRLKLARSAAGDPLPPTKKQLRVLYCPFAQRARLALHTMPSRQKPDAARQVPNPTWKFGGGADDEAYDIMLLLSARLLEALMSGAEQWWKAGSLATGFSYVCPPLRTWTDQSWVIPT